jgi:hypothetical protein
VNLKTITFWLVVLFIIFFAATAPDSAAHLAHNIWNFFVNLFHGIGHFFQSLAGDGSSSDGK